MGQILIKNAYIVTMNAKNQVYTNGSILVEDDQIIAVGKVDHQLVKNTAETINAEGKYVLPGFVNTHVHTSQQLGRGLGDDVDLLTWLHQRIWPYESNLTEEDSYISTLLCSLEQIRAGVTSFAEPGGQFVSGMVKAVSEAGLRAKLAKSVMDCGEGLPKIWQRNTQEELDQQEDDFKKYHNTADGRVQIWFGLRTIFNNSDDLIIKSKALADKYHVGLHMHVAEVKDEIDYTMEVYGEPTVTHLNRLGVLDKNFLAVHTVWLTDEEVSLFRDKQVKVSHNPAAAMRVLGFAKIPKMLKEGICVTIGTDGAPSSNRMDMVDELWLTSLIHKGWRLDPTVMKAEEILQMATKNGAQALLDEDLYGSLEVGKKADLIVINPNSASMLPLHDPIANLVTSMHSSNVESTLCNGKWLMKERIIQTLNEADILKEAKARAAAIYKRAGIDLPDRFPTITF
ncbi:amidohydrolase [Acetobacterium woodii]|uniref:Putative amidohydrolase n=1 Tax=Acetobacterium woodii (strain ATCC 29683 / DSM 1030 / JCM 2381 / KCTC 1655 / WB1) TaxID=931626 RepID=H6LCU5_ACEWD|nr:amidohydrolase [Acetobacterium woodii]AFA49082.1 putative amidohydrolase [Acetobacterium woodii DSM 1030]